MSAHFEYNRPKKLKPWRLPFVAIPLLVFLCALLGPMDRPKAAAGEGDNETPTDYVIGPADVLEVQVWREENLSRTIPVRPDGKITLPLVDDMQAAGLTPIALKRQLEQELARFIENPTVSVSVQEINSKKIYVLGRVNAPGEYPLHRGLRVLQAFSLAGGLAEWAEEGDIVILRQEGGRQVRIPFDYKKVSRGKKLEQNIILKPGDTIVVP